MQWNVWLSRSFKFLSCESGLKISWEVAKRNTLEWKSIINNHFFNDFVRTCLLSATIWSRAAHGVRSYLNLPFVKLVSVCLIFTSKTGVWCELSHCTHLRFLKKRWIGVLEKNSLPLWALCEIGFEIYTPKGKKEGYRLQSPATEKVVWKLF